MERSKCIWLTCKNSDGWNKPMDVFGNFVLKTL